MFQVSSLLINVLIIFQHIRIKKNSDGKPGHRRRSTLFELNNYQESEGTNESVRQTQSTSSPTKARFQLFVQVNNLYYIEAVRTFHVTLPINVGYSGKKNEKRHARRCLNL